MGILKKMETCVWNGNGSTAVDSRGGQLYRHFGRKEDKKDFSGLGGWNSWNTHDKTIIKWFQGIKDDGVLFGVISIGG